VTNFFREVQRGINNFNIMENSDLKIFLHCLKKIQDNKGYNLSQIAEKLNITLSYLSKVKNGRKPVTVSILHDARKMANLTTGQLIEDLINPYAANNQVKEPPEIYESKAQESKIVEHLIFESRSKTGQIDKLIGELHSLAQSIRIMSEAIKR
jgi:transcriptional regulator with XRE-family HTH domain